MNEEKTWVRIATPEERHAASAARWALAAFVIVGLLAALFVITGGKADASSVSRETSGYVVPRCLEDQVISRRGRCLDRDDSTTRYRVVSEAGWGYWVDTRYPRAMSMRPLIVACHKWQMVTRHAGCVATARADFRGGYWYRDAR